ncbi:hypothetical protein ACWKWN_19330 [Microbacterium trichothecenolyticum]
MRRTQPRWSGNTKSWDPVGTVLLLAGFVAAVVLGLATSPVIGVLTAVVLVLPLMFKLRTLAALTVLAMLFSGSLASLTRQSVLGNSDEILLALLIVSAVGSRLLKSKPLRRLPGTTWLLLFLLFGTVSSLLREVPPEVSILSAFVIMKGWLLAFALAQLEWDDTLVRSATKLGGWVIFVAIVASAANLALGQTWVTLWDPSGRVETRFGITTVQGLFTAPLAAGNVMACAFLLVFAHSLVYGMTKRHLFLMAGSAASALLSGRRTAVVGGAAASILTGLRAKAASTALFVLVLTPILIISAWSTITEVWDNTVETYSTPRDDVARTILHTDMWDVANSYFPFGAGFGRFGSFVAGENYSPEYLARNYQNVWGLHASTGNATFLTDTQWPTMIAEPGYIGAIFAVLAILALIRFAWKRTKSDLPAERWLALSTFGALILLLIASFGVPVFFGSSPPQAILFAVVGALVGYAATNSPVDEEAGRRVG